jgi:hypothetical protein
MRKSFYTTFYTTKELSTPTTKTKRSHKPRPEKTVPLFSVQPFGDARTTGTPTTNRKERAINANNESWKIRVIILRFNKNASKTMRRLVRSRCCGLKCPPWRLALPCEAGGFAHPLWWTSYLRETLHCLACRRITDKGRNVMKIG